MKITQSSPQFADPFPVTCQLGFGHYYLISTTTVFGTGNSEVKVSFQNIAGAFSPDEPLHLTPQETDAKNLDFSSAQQTLHVERIQLLVPTQNTNGYVYIVCSFTDIYGQSPSSYRGYIAAWTLCGPL